MQKQKTYEHTRFSPEVIKEAWDTLVDQSLVSETPSDELSGYTHLSVKVDDASWTHDSENEFFADYRSSSGKAEYNKNYGDIQLWIQIDVRTDFSHGNSYTAQDSRVSVKANQRDVIEAVFAVFDSKAEEFSLPLPIPAENSLANTKPTAFIGHGHDPQWRDLKDHLQDKHDIDVEAYEVGARAGHVIQDILEQMLDRSSFAILVMTAEDTTAEGQFRARQNVIHEVGLFQGKLGFNRAIVLLEEGTEEFSNIKGIHQVRFSRGGIKETYGEVLATLKREFGTSSI